ncbi:MAG: stage 0 sporulation family protein [Oscillospiraceae bacterium]|jgi:cell fate regulator YaaT (PSP1 superfamily)|nr:stage 0 sporulation family protein [Oscillospiraceae bacterium]
MTKIIGVRFRKTNRVYDFSPGAHLPRKGMPVIVETQRGVEAGDCVTDIHEVEDEKIIPPLRSVLRIADKRDLDIMRRNAEREKEAAPIFLRLVAEHKLVMKLVDTEYTFDGAKLIFYFTADGRVDFRELVKNLASVFHIRIELRQIGVRDEARMLGGLGVCGKALCCCIFLDQFNPVSIKMAKEQGLSLNPAKISGSCGRLMCCLKYEQEHYEELQRSMPGPEAIVETPQGRGTVTEVQLLRGELKVRLDSAPEVPPKVYRKGEVKLIRNPLPRADEREPEDADMLAP